jgi:hypothetical protein
MKTFSELYDKLPDWIKKYAKIFKSDERYVEFINGTRIGSSSFHISNMKGCESSDLFYLEGHSNTSSEQCRHFMTDIFPYIRRSCKNAKLIITSDGNDVFNELLKPPHDVFEEFKRGSSICRVRLKPPNNLFVKTELYE